MCGKISIQNSWESQDFSLARFYVARLLIFKVFRVPINAVYLKYVKKADPVFLQILAPCLAPYLSILRMNIDNNVPVFDSLPYRNFHFFCGPLAFGLVHSLNPFEFQKTFSLGGFIVFCDNL